MILECIGGELLRMGFYRKLKNGFYIFESEEISNISLIFINGRYRFRIKDFNNEWVYPTWDGNSFRSSDEAFEWLYLHNAESATEDSIDFDESVFSNIIMTAVSDRLSIFAAINTRNLAKSLSHVKSSNIWAYGINVRNRKDKMGDVLVQFKAKNGGAGDIYIYYDVPKTIFNRWQSAPSKGHYFWVYIRNNFKYSKLTGDKIGKLDNAINSYSDSDIKAMTNCQFMLKFVDDYVRQIIDRATFEEELPEYFSMCKDEMIKESRTLTEKFKTDIVDFVNKKSDCSDDTLRTTIRQNIREIRKFLQ